MLEFLPANPARPADWRWQWAKYIIDNNLRLSRSRSDEHIQTARKFANALNRVTEDREHVELADRYGDMYVAWLLYQSTQIKGNNKWEIEARLLARQEPEQIASRSIYSAAVIRLYSHVYFDVQSRIDAPDWITHTVIGDSINKAFDRHPDGLWKLFGYWGGPVVLDSLVYRFNNPVKPDSPKSVAGFLADDIRNQLQTKAMLAIRSLSVNWQTSVEIMNLYYRMLELENNTDAAGVGGAESFKAAVSSFMNSIPWTRKNSPTNIGVIDSVDSGPVSLRAEELLTAGAGGNVISDYIANMTYPEPNNKPAGG